MDAMTDEVGRFSSPIHMRGIFEVAQSWGTEIWYKLLSNRNCLRDCRINVRLSERLITHTKLMLLNFIVLPFHFYLFSCCCVKLNYVSQLPKRLYQHTT